ncbi:MAG: N-acetylmuramoyl-L-alanine amidase [Verrucomicrobiota bacterium]
MKSILRIIPTVVLVLASLQCRPIGPPGGGRDPYQTYQAPARQSQPVSNAPASGGTSMSGMMRQVNLKVDMVRKGTYGRKVYRRLTPRYITIHSTQNYTAGAEKHSLALKNGALRSPKTKYGNRIGFLIWHFTVDDRVAIQHMPTTEQGEHADFHGPGNCQSIGIEMCENRGNSRAATTERTAKLTAVLMKRNNIPLKNVVPHYHWPRRGKSPAHKNCPHFLMDNGRPGAKWNGFLRRVNYYYRQLNG